MCVAARTAPKTKGKDSLETIIVTGDDLGLLSRELRRIAKEHNSYFSNVTRNVSTRRRRSCSSGNVIISLTYLSAGSAALLTAENVTSAGGMCALNSYDLGIATCSAATVAAHHYVDNRIMFTVGRAALNLKLFGDDSVTMAYGIPLSVSGKSPFFDRQ